MTKIPNITMSNGQQIPVIGFGTYARNGDPELYRQASEWAIDAGYRHIDTAAMYKNEVQVGEAIANKIKEGVVRRDELFVTTKLWNDRHATKDVIPALKESLSKLKLDYVDLYLIHWPISVNLQRGIVVIPKSFTKSRMAENMELFDFELSASEMAIVDSYNIDHRCVPALLFNHLSNYPF